MDGEEAKQTLDQLEDRLRREVADMTKVLRADIPSHIVRTVRQVFERSARADDLGDGALKQLKADTEATSRGLTADLCKQLEAFETWTWDPAWPIPQDPEGLDEHPRVGEVLGRIPTSLQELLEKHGIPAAELGDLGRYRIPSYFVTGSFMKSLVANFWRAVSDHHELSQTIQEADQAEQRQARRSRWDEV